MKSNVSSLAVCCLSVIIFISTGCKKIIDEIIKKPNGVASECRVEKITSKVFTDGPDGQPLLVPDTAYYSYNKAGNPILVRHTVNANPAITPTYAGQMGMIFKYDAQNRLIAYLEGYYRDTVTHFDRTLVWHVYEYQGTNKIIHRRYPDGFASYTAGDAYQTIKNQPQGDTGGADYVTYALDAFGRIIKITYMDDAGFTTYSYNAAGNLMGDEYVYGNNIHYYQTNKVWMLINRDYSVNMRTSPIDFYSYDSPISFNSKKLPVTFNDYPHIGNGYWYIAQTPFRGEATIHYKCK